GDEVGESVDEENSGDAHVVVEKAHERAGEQHAALHANEYGSVGAGELAGRHHFLDQRVHVGPVNRGARAGDQGHEVEVPDLQVAVPCDVGNAQDREAAREIKQHAEVTAVDAVNQDAAEKRNYQARQRDHDHLPTYGHCGVRGRHDVPAHAD